MSSSVGRLESKKELGISKDMSISSMERPVMPRKRLLEEELGCLDVPPDLPRSKPRNIARRRVTSSRKENYLSKAREPTWESSLRQLKPDPLTKIYWRHSPLVMADTIRQPTAFDAPSTVPRGISNLMSLGCMGSPVQANHERLLLKLKNLIGNLEANGFMAMTGYVPL